MAADTVNDVVRFSTSVVSIYYANILVVIIRRQVSRSLTH